MANVVPLFARLLYRIPAAKKYLDANIFFPQEACATPAEQSLIALKNLKQQFKKKCRRAQLQRRANEVTEDHVGFGARARRTQCSSVSSPGFVGGVGASEYFALHLSAGPSRPLWACFLSSPLLSSLPPRGMLPLSAPCAVCGAAAFPH